MRTLVWLAVFVLVALGRVLDNDLVTAAAEPFAFAILALIAPRALRAACAAAAVCAFALLVVGGARLAIELVPALAVGLVGWLFARSLLHGRTPLIARAIAAIDGAQWLADARTRRYARILTITWAGFLGVGALFALACVLHAHGLLPMRLPPPRLLPAILPLAIALLFLGEFALRGYLLPHAPRHSLPRFVRELARVWPELVEQ